MKFIAVTLSICLFWASAYCEAAPGQHQKKLPKPQQKSLKIKNSTQAAQLVKRQTGGQILKVHKAGQKAYQVKVLKADGRIISLTVDATSGRIKGR